MQVAEKYAEWVKGILLLELEAEVGGWLVQEFDNVIEERLDLSVSLA